MRAPSASAACGQLAGQRELARELLARERIRRELTARREDAERDRQIEPGGILGQLRRREVNGDAPRRKFESHVIQRSAHSIARFAHFRIRQADDVERRQPRTQVHLDGDFGRVDASERAARYGGDCHAFPFE